MTTYTVTCTAAVNGDGSPYQFTVKASSREVAEQQVAKTICASEEGHAHLIEEAG